MKKLSLFLVAVSVFSLAQAQEVAKEEIAVIGTRTEQVQSQLPGNITIVGAEQLETLGATHVQEVLRQVPGVFYHRGNGQESLPAIRSAVLTGAGACGNILVLEEGIPVRSAGFCNVNELFDTHFEQASRVEVARGASTAFYGSNALLGTINVHLPTISQDSASLEFGPNDYLRVKASIGYAQSGISAGKIFLSVTDDGGFREQSGYEQQKLSWRQNATLGDWDVKIGATLTRLDQETAGFVAGEDAYLDDSIRRLNFDPEAFRKTDSARVWASFTKQIGQSELVVTPYIRDTEMDFLLHFLPGDPLEQNEQTGMGWQSALTTNVNDSFSWSVGVDAEFAEGALLQTQDAPTQGPRFLQVTIPTGTHYDYTVDSTQAAAFAHLDWQMNERWLLIAGGRLENIRYDYDNLGLDGRTKDDGTECGFGGCRYSRPADRRDEFTHFSPKLELQYQASEQLRWHFALADSFRAPQATELYRLQREQTVAELDEVSATHAELGFRWSSAATELAVSLYQIDQSNVIIRDSDFFNVGGQKVESVGVEVAWRQQLSEPWQLRVVGSYAKHEYASDQMVSGVNINGNVVDTAPEIVASAFLGWQATPRLSAELELHHVSDYFLEPNNRFSYPGHTLWHLRANYKISESFSTAFRLLNVGDRLYAERADFTSFSDQRYFPGERRALFGELRWQF